MKFTLAALALSALLTTHASARVSTNDLGFPWNAPADTWDSGDLSYEEMFGEEMAKNAMWHINLPTKASEAVSQFLSNPLIRDYLIRETQTWDNLSGPVIQAYVTAPSVLNERTGENFKAAAAPDSISAIKLLSLQRNLLPHEAKISYLLNPKMESGEYLSEDQKAHVLQYIKNNFPQRGVREYIDIMQGFSTD
ncbi:hypothetical protein [Candidatus Paracaedibacter symbiosus]|uniref:hypothetical protein n=1 Tax=Candidatus Paracaedibacter symbiosus TaxID=244582 RepID=UPI000509BF35|nr:hypothetical protein [Candidatus Paracaedibacter symbiosus]